MKLAEAIKSIADLTGLSELNTNSCSAEECKEQLEEAVHKIRHTSFGNSRESAQLLTAFYKAKLMLIACTRFVKENNIPNVNLPEHCTDAFKRANELEAYGYKVLMVAQKSAIKAGSPSTAVEVITI